MKKNNPPMAEVTYTGELRCTSLHVKSGQVIESDAPTDNQGKGMKFSPTDLMSTSLAKCMLTVMGIRTQEMEGNLDGSKAEVYKTMASNPRRVEKIEIHLHLPGERFSEKEREMLERVGLNCPVAKSLSPELVQDVHFDWSI